MSTKMKIISYILSLAIAAAVAFGTGYSSTIDALLLAVVWLLIILGGISTTLVGIMVIMRLVITQFGDIPIDVIEKWKEIKSPNWWISLPISIAWLSALVYVEWTVTAVVYFIETVLLWLVSTILFKSIREIVTETLGKNDPINSILNPSVKQAVLDSRKDK